MPVLVRYFAGARAAAGVAEEKVDASQVDELVAALGQRHGPRLAAVLDASSLLLDGLAVRDRTIAVPDGATVEVLPPFAGG
ncbi:MAG: MoaD/ThiS family protein [Jatrophihabitans sp.]